MTGQRSSVLPILAGATVSFFLFSAAVQARSINDGIGRTSFTWLKTVSDAGISAAGECIAARDDLPALLVHPAAVAGLETPTLKMSFVSHYVDTQYGSVGYARRYRGRQLGIRLMYINYGEFNGRDINNQPTGTFSAGDVGITFNVGKKLRDDLKVGAQASFITSKIDEFSAQAATVDLGILYIPPFEGLTVGAVLMNMGKVLKGYSSGYTETMPVYLSVGARKKLAHAPFTLYTDVVFPNDYDIIYAYGIEAEVKKTLFLYAGTRSLSDIDRETQKATTDFAGKITFGFGIDLAGYRFNYAYCPDDNINDVHKITLTVAARLPHLPGRPAKKQMPVPSGQSGQVQGTTSAPVQPVTVVPIHEESVTKVDKLSFHTIYFDFDKYNIRSDQISSMNNNAALLSANTTVKVLIEGHCDERGTDEYNIALGERRASSVKSFLVDYGMDPLRITTISYGEEHPADPGHDETAWAKNRRIEFIITTSSNY